jgi:DNA-binding GntR family transcriptional regulator
MVTERDRTAQPGVRPRGVRVPGNDLSVTGASFLSSAVTAVPSRTVVVLDAIKHAILAGELRPGQSLVEADLAEALGVSKTPVREALKTLAGSGLVTMSPYKGATVRSVDDEMARSVYDVRLLLEPEAVRRAVMRGFRPDPAREALERAGAATDQAERSLANRDFHRGLYLGCGNALLIEILDDLRDQAALVSALAWQRTPTWQEEAAEHRGILASALAGDAEGTCRRLRSHIESFVQRNFPFQDRGADES